MKKIILGVLTIFIIINKLYSYDWDNLPVPANAEDGYEWQLLEDFSDDFNYNAKTDNNFISKWNDHYFKNWLGPGLTEWTSNNSWIENGSLVIKASRKPGTNKVYCGVVTSKNLIKYPVFMEAKILVMNQVLSSNFWLLSPDDRREIDILEIYGGDRPDQEWYARNAGVNYHVFIRDPNTNAIIEDIHLNGSHYIELPDHSPYRLTWHRFGAYWKDPWHVDYYIDGRLVYSLTPENLVDPENKGLDRSMHIIIDVEDHAWRSNQGIYATDEELADETKNKMYIDWVRVYKPVPITPTPNQPPVVNFIRPTKTQLFKEGDNVAVEVEASDQDGNIKQVNLFINGKFIRPEKVYPYLWNDNGQDSVLNNMAAGTYVIKAVAIDDRNGMSSDSVIIQVNKTTKVKHTMFIDKDNIVFPNPISLKAFLKVEPEVIKSIKVYNINGEEEAVKVENSGNKVSIDMSLLKDGIYIIEVAKRNGEVIRNKVYKIK